MSFLDSLAKAISSEKKSTQIDSTTVVSSENSDKLISKREPMLITVSELDRRVNSVFTKAVELGNLPYLQGVSAFVQSPSSLSDTTACISVDSPAAALEVYQWCTTNFKDLIDDTSFQLICRAGASSKEISAAQNAYRCELGLNYAPEAQVFKS
jgi:hypothetical protein